MTKKKLLVPLTVIALVVVGITIHDLAATLMVEERIAGVLLGAGAGGRPAEAGFALLFVGLRILGLPLAGAALLGTTVHVATTVGAARLSRRNQSR
jgi:hypothetical protein